MSDLTNRAALSSIIMRLAIDKKYANRASTLGGWHFLLLTNLVMLAHFATPQK
jgi:hypothetical protein